MPEDIDVLDDQVEETEVESTEQDEPQTTLPDHAASEKAQSRQELIDQTLAEGGTEAEVQQVIDDLGDVTRHPELTLEDLKSIPGAENMTDDQLKAEWAKAVQAAGGEAQAQGQAGSAEQFKLPFPIYDKQGNKVELDKVTVQDLLNGNLQLSYNAMGKEQKKTLTEALRNASMGHFNEQRYNTTIEERNRVQGQLSEVQKQVEQFSSERKVWEAALSALTMGNVEPMKRLAAAYQQALTQIPQANIPGMVSIESVRAEQEQTARGQQFINETIMPAGMDIAKRYGADPKEVIGAIEAYIKRDLNFLTREKIDQIIQYEVPQLLEANGYTASAEGQPAGQTGPGQIPTNEVAELKKTVEALRASIASRANAATAATRAKQKKAPPQGSGATPGAGDSMPSFKSRAQFKAWSRGDTDWQKA